MEQMPFKQKKNWKLPLRQSLTAQGAGGVGMIRIQANMPEKLQTEYLHLLTEKKLCKQRDIQALYGNVHNRMMKENSLKF